MWLYNLTLAFLFMSVIGFRFGWWTCWAVGTVCWTFKLVLSGSEMTFGRCTWGWFTLLAIYGKWEKLSKNVAGVCVQNEIKFLPKASYMYKSHAAVKKSSFQSVRLQKGLHLFISSCTSEITQVHFILLPCPHMTHLDLYTCLALIHTPIWCSLSGVWPSQWDQTGWQDAWWWWCLCHQLPHVVM